MTASATILMDELILIQNEGEVVVRSLRNLLMGNGLVAGRMETKQSRTSAQSLVTCSIWPFTLST